MKKLLLVTMVMSISLFSIALAVDETQVTKSMSVGATVDIDLVFHIEVKDAAGNLSIGPDYTTWRFTKTDWDAVPYDTSLTELPTQTGGLVSTVYSNVVAGYDFYVNMTDFARVGGGTNGTIPAVNLKFNSLVSTQLTGALTNQIMSNANIKLLSDNKAGGACTTVSAMNLTVERIRPEGIYNSTILYTLIPR